MSPSLSGYLSQAYRRDVLAESDKVVMPELTPELVAEAKAEVARIDGLRLGASLVSRDFAAYHARNALMKLLEADNAPAVGTGLVQK